MWRAGGSWPYKIGTGSLQDEDVPPLLFARVFVPGYSVDGVTAVPHWETKILAMPRAVGTTTVATADGGSF